MTEAEWKYISYCLEKNDGDAIETELRVNTCKLYMSEQELDGIIRNRQNAQEEAKKVADFNNLATEYFSE